MHAKSGTSDHMRSEPQLEEELGEAGHQAHDAQAVRIKQTTVRCDRPGRARSIIVHGRIK
jgi:hypothetical protein